MAEVFKKVGGRKTEKFIAIRHEVQKELTNRMVEIGNRAEALLASHKDEGHSEIEVSAGKVDRYITLSDDRGQKAAMSIEYGRDGDANGKGGMEGLFILHRAAHLKKKGGR